MAEEKELLGHAKYDKGVILDFYVYRMKKDGRNCVSLSYIEEGKEEVWFRDFFYDDEAAAYQSEYLSWYNLIFCSNNYGPIPVVKYMNHAVQEGKKVAATVYPVDSNEYMNIMRETFEDYYCFPYNVEEYSLMLYISKKGTLNDYFDKDAILKVYQDCGIELNRERMDELFAMELKDFAKKETCGFMLHECYGSENLAVLGLLFGYPVESTVALLKDDITMLDL
ncbi:MAG: hypothetical protein K6G01_08205 [Eubacterium sp.]|nr:hypothetical protein [Eubacterium sp.]